MVKKGQSAIEFMIIIGVVLFFFIAFLGALQVQSSDKVKERRTVEVQEVALTVRGEIDLASDASDGYQRNFDLPLTISRENYNVSIVEGLVYVITEDERDALTYPIVDVIGQPQKGNNLIRKVNGVIYLNS